ncbi:DegT/DnrJ/EryC1/StrS family aminotransferase [Vibrio alginolyticus]
MEIKLNSPLIPNEKKLMKYIERIHNSKWLTNFGPLHQELTRQLEEYLGVSNLLLVNNGTSALNVAYQALDVKKAVTTPFSFVATSSSLLWQKINTSFVDVDPDSYNISPRYLEKYLMEDLTTDSIVATHVYGNPCEVDALSKIAENNNCSLIYDAAHAFGVKYDEKSVLTYGDASTISFHATKVFHTVEGGAIVFKNEEILNRAKEIINFGINKFGDINYIGTNAKLNEYQCAVGLVLLENIGEVIEHRTELYELYFNELKDLVDMPTWCKNSTYNGAYFPINPKSQVETLNIISTLKDNGIESRRYFDKPLNVIYSSAPQEKSEELCSKVMCLPLHYYMTKKDVLRVVDVVKRGLR